MKNAILLQSGKFYSYDNPESNEFTIEDIALSLSNICRYTGQVETFYSVAQHAVIVSHVIDKEFALDGLCHDNVEAFMQDIPTPLKALLPEYKAMERLHEKDMFNKLGLQYPMHPSVHEADYWVFCAEVRDMKPSNSHWDKFLEIDTSHIPKITPWTPSEARCMFLERYYELTK